MGSSELWRHSYSLPNIVHIYRQISIQVSGFILILTHYGYHEFYWSQILTDKKWVVPLEILCMIMFDISKMVPKRFFCPIKSPQLFCCICWLWSGNILIMVTVVGSGIVLLSDGTKPFPEPTEPLGTHFSQISIKIQNFSFKKMLSEKRTELQQHLSNSDGFVQERRNSSANALELHLSCTD